MKSIMHYDVDENLRPNPQDRVDKNIEVQQGTLQFAFYCRPTLVIFFSYLFFYSYLKFFEKPAVSDYFINNFSNYSRVCIFLSSLLQ